MFETNKIIGGIQVMVNPYHPTEFSHWGKERWEAHPIIKWLAKWLLITPYVERKLAIHKDSDPLYYKEKGVLFCSPAQEQALRRELAPHDPRVDTGWRGPGIDLGRFK